YGAFDADHLCDPSLLCVFRDRDSESGAFEGRHQFSPDKSGVGIAVNEGEVRIVSKSVRVFRGGCGDAAEIHGDREIFANVCFEDRMLLRVIGGYSRLQVFKQIEYRDQSVFVANATLKSRKQV